MVTVYFALGRRSPVQGTLMGARWASSKMRSPTTPSASTASPKPSVGFLAASVGVRIDVENHTIRLVLIFLLSLLSSAIFVFIYRFLLGLDLEWRWFTELFRAIGNSLIALVLFPLLDRLQIRD